MKNSESFWRNFDYQFLQSQAAQARRRDSPNTQRLQQTPARLRQRPRRDKENTDKENKPPRNYFQNRLPRGETDRAPLRDLTNQAWVQRSAPVDRILSLAEIAAINRETSERLRQVELARMERESAGDSLMGMDEGHYEGLRGIILEQLESLERRRENEAMREQLGQIIESAEELHDVDEQRESSGSTPLHQLL